LLDLDAAKNANKVIKANNEKISAVDALVNIRPATTMPVVVATK